MSIFWKRGKRCSEIPVPFFNISSIPGIACQSKLKTIKDSDREEKLFPSPRKFSRKKGRKEGKSRGNLFFTLAGENWTERNCHILSGSGFDDLIRFYSSQTNQDAPETGVAVARWREKDFLLLVFADFYLSLFPIRFLPR